MAEITLAPGLGISSTGLDAESRWMEVIANNIANAQARNADGTPYQRKEALFAERLAGEMQSWEPASNLQGVEISEIVTDKSDPIMIYRPNDPFANKEGFVAMPNINIAEEMVDMMSASHSYQANLAAARTAKQMVSQSLEMLKD